ncbi:MAG: TRAP transporter large permease subunit [Rhodospirillales bacterium]
MDPLLASFIVLCLLVFYLGLGVWIFSGLMLLSVSALIIVLDFPIDRIGAIAKGIVWRSSSAWELAAIPMFILMGELIFRTDISERLFKGLAPLVEGIPGRLLHTNVLGCTVFAAVSGSSTATTATVGKMTCKALAERNYDRNLTVGSLAGAGSLGLLIPPSILMIIYGVLAEVSISKLFIAGIVPGLTIAGLYSLYIAVLCLWNKGKAPPEQPEQGEWRKLRAIGYLFPVVILIVTVLGGIYSGLVTPSEAAAIGVTATVIMTIILGQFSFRMFGTAIMSAVKSSCMICLILSAAALLSSTMGFMHVPVEIAKAISALDLGPYLLIFLLGIFYVVLGLFLDGISITVMTLPITLPLIQQAGFDPIWFGVFLVIMVEMGLITPPLGFNLFVLQGITGESLNTVARAAAPFFLLMALAAVGLTIFPQMALWLPQVLGG